MPDYKKMYSILFNAVTDATEILQNSQLATEEIFISEEEDTGQQAKIDNKRGQP